MPGPHPKGSKIGPIKRLPVSGWDDDGNFVVTVKVSKVPKMSASRKCWLYAFEHGETDQVVNIDGKDRQVRMTFMLYVKIPATERHATLRAEAEKLDKSGDPQLF